LGLQVPKQLRNVLPALLLFIILTWLELGVGVTIDPYATALLALIMVVLVTISLAMFERKAFCRYFCPVGRTIGFYAQLAPVELRPKESSLCASCSSLECYHGSKTVDACPTQLVMGRQTQNTYCTSCGNCYRACPHDNITWRLRPPSTEAIQAARPHWDEAWFMLGLMALTAFHGLSMMPFWEIWMGELARFIGDSGQLLWSFSIGMTLSMLLPLLLYIMALWLTQRFTGTTLPFKRLFSLFAFLAIPLAFTYHVAHNLNHLIHETVGISTVFTNPLGINTLPLSAEEKSLRHLQTLFSPEKLFALQTGLLIFGFLIAIFVIRQRGRELLIAHNGRHVAWRLVPMIFFCHCSNRLSSMAVNGTDGDANVAKLKNVHMTGGQGVFVAHLIGAGGIQKHVAHPTVSIY
jgi:ferredoxin